MEHSQVKWKIKWYFLLVFVARNVVTYKTSWMFACKRHWFTCRNVLFQFSVKLDDLLEMLCSEIEAEDVPSAEAAIQNLIDKCENLGTIISTIMWPENVSKYKIQLQMIYKVFKISVFFCESTSIPK